ncbi:NUDIX hydrolase [Qipengyuania sp.]|uniref:NUDIX hydrolase n=1 Tax=Qipengyuania sp. TaxID=2004515 RepID=UPI0035C8060A
MIDRAFRVALNIAHTVRHRWRRWRKVHLHGVSMVARDLDGKLLLVRLSYAEAGWSFPGGGARRGEAMRDAAIRELTEETGCSASAVRALGTFEEVVSGSPHTAHIFTCITDNAPKPDGREVVEARFFPLHSLPHPLTPRTQERLAFWQDRSGAVKAD